jgi:hypothetical protein
VKVRKGDGKVGRREDEAEEVEETGVGEESGEILVEEDGGRKGGT